MCVHKGSSCRAPVRTKAVNDEEQQVLVKGSDAAKTGSLQDGSSP